jgi:hypothetical protein
MKDQLSESDLNRIDRDIHGSEKIQHGTVMLRTRDVRALLEEVRRRRQAEHSASQPEATLPWR